MYFENDFYTFIKLTPLSGYTSFPFKATLSEKHSTTQTVYEKGAGLVIVISQELPGIGPETLELVDRLEKKGFTIILPHLLGPIGKKPRLNLFRVFCMSREFKLFKSNHSSPIVTWLKALCQHVTNTYQVNGVGVIGMCLTGNKAFEEISPSASLKSYHPFEKSHFQPILASKIKYT